MAAGTFLYVGCNEVVAEEFEPRAHRLSKFGCMIGGMAIIAYLASLDTD